MLVSYPSFVALMRRFNQLLMPWLCIALLNACTNQNQQPAPPPPIDHARIAVLLAEAEAAETAKHLLEPVSGSAVELYRKVLALNPEDPVAARRIEGIAEAFMTQARQAAERQQYNIAWLALDRARRTDPLHPNIAATTQFLQTHENAKRYRLGFTTAQLDAQTKDTVLLLQGLGERAKNPSCRTTITAASDAQGRWMYQQLRQAQGDGRVRAQVQVGRPSAVEVMCF